MLQLTKRILRSLPSQTLKLLLLAGAILLLWGTFAPIKTLVWWLNRGTERLELQKQQPKIGVSINSLTDASEIDCYIIFLPGVGDFSANQLTQGEEFFLDRLVTLHPNCVAVRDVFPYSLTHQGLGGEQLLAPLWRAAKKADGWFANANILIKIRNLWRFAISADERYGPIYNRGIAATIIDRMNAAHPIPQSRQKPLKIVLIGTSGGTQVALGATSYLNKRLDAQLLVISIGGDFDGDTGFDVADRVYHIQGRRDWIEDISRLVFPSRWPWTVASPFNQARRQKRYIVRGSGPHAHSGEKGYFGLAIALANTTYVELTLEEVNQLPIWSD